MVAFRFSCRRTSAIFMSPAVVTASFVQVPCVTILHRLHLPVHGSPWRRVRGHQTHNALVLPPASTVAARLLCVSGSFCLGLRVEILISTLHVKGCFCSSTLTIDSSRLPVEARSSSSTRPVDSSRPSRRGLLPVGHFFFDSSRVVYRHVLFHLS